MNSVDKTKCRNCGALILQRTAIKYNGYCARCWKILPEQHQNNYLSSREEHGRGPKKINNKDRLFLIMFFGVLVVVCIFCAWVLIIEPTISTKPIHRAAIEGDFQQIQLLVREGTPIDLPGPWGKTPLYLALEHGHELEAQILMQMGATVKKPGILKVALVNPNIHINTIVQLITLGTEVPKDIIIQYLAESFTNAEENNTHFSYDLLILDLLLDNGADINAKYSWKAIRSFPPDGSKTFEEYSALHLACFKRDLELVKYFVNKKADINILTKYNSTPLNIACSSYRVYEEKSHEGPGIHYYTVAEASPQIRDYLQSNGADTHK